MANDLAKRFLTKDGKKRISIYQEEYPEDPRDMTDEPLHCEDWSREYTIMNKDEREKKSDDAAHLIKYMLERFGNTDEIIKVLKENHKKDEHFDGENCLMYDRVSRSWILFYWQDKWQDYYGGYHGNQWVEEARFYNKLCDISAWDVASYLSEEQVEKFADKKYFTDGVKIGSYSFGYYGGISFEDDFTIDSEGIAWLEKDEFLKYSGCTEELWNSKSLKEIEFLCDEIEAWADNEVYGFVVEKAVRTVTNVRYPDGEHDDSETESIEWEEVDSCWGFYGEVNKNLEYILEYAGFKLDELDEQ